MSNAHMILGVAFLIVFFGAAVLMRPAEAPVSLEESSPVVFSQEAVTSTSSEVSMSLRLTSPAFPDGGKIPSKYTCDGENVNPELNISGVPDGTQSLVLVMDDPDIPQSVKEARGIEKFDHWVLYNIEPETSKIPEGAFLLGQNTDGGLGQQGLNGRGEASYAGPCPPDREHRYIYRLYALSETLNFIKPPTLDEVEQAAKGSSIADVTFIGKYERIKQ